MAEQATHPIDTADEQQAPHLTIQAHHRAADGSEWLREGDGYRKVVGAWDTEQHIPPFKAHERLGDVPSFCDYVQRFGQADRALLTWTTGGLKAVLDYGRIEEPDRKAAIVEHPFQTTRQWQAWQRIANGNAIGQKALIEALEEHRQDVQDPDAATIVGLIASLRANVNVAATSELSAGGNTTLSFSRQTTVSVKLPTSITIGIPVLKGHTAPDSQGVEGPVRYAIEVLIRVDVLDGGKLAFRLSMPNAEQALEDAVADRVAAARALLGEAFPLLRAAS